MPVRLVAYSECAHGIVSGGNPMKDYPVHRHLIVLVVVVVTMIVLFFAWSSAGASGFHAGTWTEDRFDMRGSHGVAAQ